MKFVSSILANLPASPPLTSQSTPFGISSLLPAMSLTKKPMSSLVNGLPSDHFRPSRSLTVKTLPSGVLVTDSARLGMTLPLHSRSQATSGS